MNRFDQQHRPVFLFLLLILIMLAMTSVRFGAVNISWIEILSSIQKWIKSEEATLSLRENIFLQIRFPRAILCIATGASLAIAGVLMQALFRNPIVEPGLIGTSSGAAFGAALYLVLGSSMEINAGEWTLSIAACIGGIIATLLVMMFANSNEMAKSSVVVLLLTGIAINSLFMSGVGFLSYIARDPQARSVTFWNLGTLSGASWSAVWVVSAICGLCFLIALRYSKALNALMLGEEDALMLGANITMLKKNVMALNVLLVAVTTAFVGVIGFVGLIAPHLIRILIGSDNRYLIIGSAMMGAILLTSADLIARLLLAPAELPIGVVTSFVGVPIFLYLLKKRNQYFF
ncbi:MAG: iron ABC transporter permease [Sporocytophaga sp.]|uniref:FecCD family ABC transporter permease n=1 Tax=Sporocytophaga sp. TaxID=2231183 RepID=UPI001B05E4CD|nr:iron ABC transporter permease [Sporocytophaga sp.]MBO9700714.1 iron ABC transporter permease [Sporocytophaga sp.]